MDVARSALRGITPAAVAAYVAVVLVSLAAWLHLPRRAAAELEVGPAVRACVVDASASVRRRRPDWSSWVRGSLAREARAALAAGEEVAVVSFASDVRLTFGPGDPRALLDWLEGRERDPFDPRRGAGADDETRLADAVRVALPLVAGSERAPGRLVVLGDGESTGPDPLPALARARRAGATLVHERPPPPEFPDLALLSLSVPRVVEPSAPLYAVARVRYSPGRRAAERALLAVTIRADGIDRPLLVPLDLPDREETWEVGIECGAAAFGRTRVHVRGVLVPELDAIPENNDVLASCVAEGELVIGVAAREASLSSARDWLTPSGSSSLPGIQFVYLGPGELVGGLDELDALVTFDLPLASLPAALLESYVLRGGGWLAVSGWKFLGDWAPGGSDTGLHALLPLRAAPSDQGPRDVILLVDGSGSMEGGPFDTVRAASVELVSAALPGDRVSLRFFTTNLEPEILVKARSSESQDMQLASEEAARRLLVARVPGGQTYILRSLGQFASDRERVGPETLAFLLTDGREREHVQERQVATQSLKERLRAAKARLVVIAVGEEYDLRFLQLLTRPGEEVTHADELEDLQAIFRREISGARLREGVSLDVRTAPAPPDSLAREVLGSTVDEARAIPPVARYVLNRTRAGAEVLWESDDGDPLLGVQRTGLGRTALFSSTPGIDWAPRWTRLLGIGEPARFGVLLRWLGRGTARFRHARPWVEVSEDGGSVVLHGVDATWPARFEVRVVDAAPRARERGAIPALAFELAPSTAGTDPLARRVARIPDELGTRRGAAGLTLVFPRLTPGNEGLVLPLNLGLGRELTRGGAQVDPAVFGPAGQAEAASGSTAASLGRAHPAAPWVLLAGLGLLLLGALLMRRS